MEALRELLLAEADGDLLPWDVQRAAAERFGLTTAVVEEEALLLGLLPARYRRNRETISVAQQLTLFRSRVAVIGCGGLGGYVIEELARLGVGTLVAVDPDRFEEHNLNRQILSGVAALGRPKVEVAAERVRAINPAVTLRPVAEMLGPGNGAGVLAGAHVVVDAVDSVAGRLGLCALCVVLGVPLVHGAIAGWYGQVATEFPGDGTVAALYGFAGADRGEERRLGNPSFTPAVVASLQAAEVCKLLLGVGEPLRRRAIIVNLLDMSVEEFPFDG